LYAEVKKINRELQDVPMGGDETMIIRRAISFACDGPQCGVSLPGDKPRFGCIEDACLVDRTTLDLCASCAPKHQHPVRLCISGARAIRGYRTVAETLQNRLLSYEERACIGVFHDDQLGWLSYGELHSRALSVLGLLQTQRKLPRGERVAIYGANSLSWIVCDIALQLGGMQAVLLEANTPPPVVVQLLMSSSARLVFCDNWLECDVPQIRLSELDAATAEVLCDGTVCTDASPDHVSTIIFTSGSTGLPKGVQVKNSQVVRSAFRCCLLSLLAVCVQSSRGGLVLTFLCIS
jgi:long-subunit acyl-CoA synthetase (AMP-forming)